jgi:hypothetical protein
MNTAPERPGQPAIPSYVVIPVKNNLALTSALPAPASAHEMSMAEMEVRAAR